MDRGLPTSPLGLLSRLAGVVLPSPVNEVYVAIWSTRPRKRRNSIDNGPEFAERLQNLTRHRFAGFFSAHRATILDSRTLQHASDTIPSPGSTAAGTCPHPTNPNPRRKTLGRHYIHFF